MDIKRIIPVLCILGVFVWGGIKLKKGFTKLMNTDVTTQRVEGGSFANGLSRGGFAQYLRAAKSMNAEIGLSAISKECYTYVNAVENLDLMAFRDSTSFRVTYQQLTEPTSTCSLTDDLIASAEKDYLSQCFLNNPTKTDLISEPCAQAIFALRSSMTRMLLKNKKVSELEAPEKLTDLLYFEVLLTQQGADSPAMNMKRVEEIIDRLLEINPNLKSARRVKFFIVTQNTIAEAKTKTLKDQDEIWGKLKADLEDSKKSNGLDDGAQELDALIQTRGFDPSLTLKYSSDLLAANPNSAWAMLLSAYGHWKNDDHEDAFKEVKKATELDPQRRFGQD
jgi:tetratricopeptide (TPR) repeat protein